MDKVLSSQPTKVQNIIENDQQGSRGAYKEYQTHPPCLYSSYVFFYLMILVVVNFARHLE